MRVASVMKALAVVVPVYVLAYAPTARAGGCKEFHADLVEHKSTQGCLNPARSCFLGEVEGNHGLRGVTHFQGEEVRALTPGSPGWVSYNGFFHYTLKEGTLVARETGITNAGFVTAHHQIVDGTGAFAGATGYFFVSGVKFDNGDTIVTRVTGELCIP
ncbi:hypothetical protein [Pyxidicoccus sp. MSG2]|uniref:hypothetical protein n=1 Tax=Pyxidicoccus sp. MSG2 TaxID=2996790 RepID=UPI0022721864|nr:hypothetical protein [Pyxidicoccus sp. MSG2]MCY1023874.1 hypothetical protein [Pyxidicoccus sp. MSG2]